VPEGRGVVHYRRFVMITAYVNTAGLQLPAAQKIGLSILSSAFIVLEMLLLFHQMIPNIVMWIFYMGQAVTLISSCVVLFKNIKDKKAKRRQELSDHSDHKGE
jgi:hypothetical protein